MIQKDRFAGSAQDTAGGCKLIISCPRPSPRPRRMRNHTILYVSRGYPEITSAEVEMMFDHLRSGAIALEADNENV